MMIRRAAITLATAASLVLIPTTAYAGNDKHQDDCRDDKKWFDYKYAPQCECDDKDHDHRDHDRDKDRDKDRPKTYTTKAPKTERLATYQGRVLKTN